MADIAKLLNPNGRNIIISPWRAQHESPENTYLSNKLKYHLYYNALDKIFTYAKEYGKSKGLDIKCYVPTHSLINYTSWQIEVRKPAWLHWIV